MNKRGPFIAFIVALTAILFPSVLAQGFPISFDSFLTMMVENQFFAFLFFFGLFFAAASASLSRVFQGNIGRVIALFVALLMTVGGMYSGYLNIQMFGPWSLLFLLVLLALTIMHFFVMGRERAPNYKIILLGVFAVGLFVITFIPDIPDVIWNPLFLVTIITGVVGIVVYALNLSGRIGVGSGERGPPGEPREPGEPGQPREPGKPEEEDLIIEIDQPENGQEFGIGDDIPFKAIIHGGTAPFRADLFVGRRRIHRWARIVGENMINLPGGIPTERLREGSHNIRIVVTGNGRRQRANQNVNVTLIRREEGELRVTIESPRGEINADDQITIRGRVEGGQAPYNVIGFVDGAARQELQLGIIRDGNFQLPLGITATQLGMLAGRQHHITLGFTDSTQPNALRGEGSTEVTVRGVGEGGGEEGQEPQSDLSVRINVPAQNHKFPRDIPGVPFTANIIRGQAPFNWILNLNGQDILSETSNTRNLSFSLPISRIREQLARGQNNGLNHVLIIRVTDANYREGQEPVETSVRFSTADAERDVISGPTLNVTDIKDTYNINEPITFTANIVGGRPHYIIYVNGQAVGQTSHNSVRISLDAKQLHFKEGDNNVTVTVRDHEDHISVPERIIINISGETSEAETKEQEEKPERISVRILEPVNGKTIPEHQTLLPILVGISGGNPPFNWVYYLNDQPGKYSGKTSDNQIGWHIKLKFRRVIERLSKSKDGNTHTLTIEITDREGNKATDSVSFIYDIRRGGSTEEPPREDFAVKITQPQLHRPQINEFEGEDRIKLPIRAELIGGTAPFTSVVKIVDRSNRQLFRRVVRTRGNNRIVNVPNIPFPEGLSRLIVASKESGTKKAIDFVDVRVTSKKKSEKDEEKKKKSEEKEKTPPPKFTKVTLNRMSGWKQVLKATPNTKLALGVGISGGSSTAKNPFSYVISVDGKVVKKGTWFSRGMILPFGNPQQLGLPPRRAPYSIQIGVTDNEGRAIKRDLGRILEVVS